MIFPRLYFPKRVALPQELFYHATQKVENLSISKLNLLQIRSFRFYKSFVSYFRFLLFYKSFPVLIFIIKKKVAVVQMCSKITIYSLSFLLFFSKRKDLLFATFYLNDSFICVFCGKYVSWEFITVAPTSLRVELFLRNENTDTRFGMRWRTAWDAYGLPT